MAFSYTIHMKPFAETEHSHLIQWNLFLLTCDILPSMAVHANKLLKSVDLPHLQDYLANVFALLSSF